MWQDALKTSLVGTERQAPPKATGEDDISALLERIDDADRERLLLRTAGVLALCRRAGYTPRRDAGPVPEPAGETDLPRCSAASGQDLGHLIDGDARAYLPEWLRLAAKRGLRAPDEHLPALLIMGHGDKEWRELIMPVLGARGRWLAAQNPDWAYAAVLGPEEAMPDPEAWERIWQTGTRAERVPLLMRLRRSDPERARDLIQSTWAQDPADDRASFLRTMDAGLSMFDEPFLESALDDRRKEVRWEAANLLARLPDSRLVERMWERAVPCLKMERKMLGQETLQVSLPKECDKAMIRDGIEPKPPSYPKTGERAWWFLQIIERVPPERWCRHFNRPAAAVVSANRTKEWGKQLLKHWLRAAVRFSDREWITLTLDGLTDEDWSNMAPNEITGFPPDILDAHILRLLRAHKGPLFYGNHVFMRLYQLRDPWSAELQSEVARRLAACVPGSEDDRGCYGFSILKELSEHLPADVVDRIYTTWLARPSLREHAAVNRFQKLADEARFRREMLERLKANR